MLAFGLQAWVIAVILLVPFIVVPFFLITVRRKGLDEGKPPDELERER